MVCFYFIKRQGGKKIRKDFTRNVRKQFEYVNSFFIKEKPSCACLKHSKLFNIHLLKKKFMKKDSHNIHLIDWIIYFSQYNPGAIQFTTRLQVSILWKLLHCFYVNLKMKLRCLKCYRTYFWWSLKSSNQFSQLN